MECLHHLHRDVDRRSFVKGAATAGVGAVAGAAMDWSYVAQAHADQAAGEEKPYEPLGCENTQTDDESAPVVYFTKDISPEGIARVWEALGAKPQGKVGFKVSIGTFGGDYYLKPYLVKDLVQSLGADIVECNMWFNPAGNVSRQNTESHLKTADAHGWSLIADVNILDAGMTEDDQISLPVEGGFHLTEDLVGKGIEDYDYYVSAAHFKGHPNGGFGGAIKNITIGFASGRGKNLIHSAGAQTEEGYLGWTQEQDAFLESMADASKAVTDYLGDNICYINVMDNLSVDCDCGSRPTPSTMADIGVLASFDPVAIDKACVDLVYAAPDGLDLIERMETRHGLHTLECAAKLGVGSLAYRLVDIDE